MMEIHEQVHGDLSFTNRINTFSAKAEAANNLIAGRRKSSAILQMNAATK